MKKIYMQPLTEVVKINVEQMICESEPQLGGSTDASEGNLFKYDDNDDYDSNLW